MLCIQLRRALAHKHGVHKLLDSAMWLHEHRDLLQIRYLARVSARSHHAAGISPCESAVAFKRLLQY
jgi:hypothetical protein